jgi:transposase InsO family protein
MPGPVRIGLQRQFNRLNKRRELDRSAFAPVLGLLQHRRLQPLAHRVARQTRQPHDLPNRLLLAEIHPLDFANHGHGDHSLPPAHERGRVGETPGPNLGWHWGRKWVSFRLASTRPGFRPSSAPARPSRTRARTAGDVDASHEKVVAQRALAVQLTAHSNALAESFFASLECELIDRRVWKTLTEARLAVFTWTLSWYNPQRLHSGLGYQPPNNFERKLQEIDAVTTSQEDGLPTGCFALVDSPLCALVGAASCPHAMAPAQPRHR